MIIILAENSIAVNSVFRKKLYYFTFRQMEFFVRSFKVETIRRQYFNLFFRSRQLDSIESNDIADFMVSKHTIRDIQYLHIILFYHHHFFIIFYHIFIIIIIIIEHNQNLMQMKSTINFIKLQNHFVYFKSFSKLPKILKLFQIFKYSKLL